MIAFPDIDPVALQLGPLAIRWYSLAYIAGIFLGWFYVAWLDKKTAPNNLSQKQLEDLVVYVVTGIIAGGRLGYVLFYNLPYYSSNPLDALMLWHGGMSFHGGLLGVITAIYIFAHKQKIKFYAVTDIAALATPIGLFFGRIANFINGELYGRVTDAPWGVIFPRGGDLPRHPSQIYEAIFEGLVLFTLLFCLAFFTKAKQKTGMISGFFLAGYGIARFIIEFFREPDEQIGFLFGLATMGQTLCLPMILFGSYLIINAARSRN